MNDRPLPGDPVDTFTQAEVDELRRKWEAQYTVQGEPITDLQRDAERWRALMSSQRIRVMGSAGFQRVDGKFIAPSVDHAYLHMGVEFWSVHESKHPSEEFPQDRCRDQLTAYVDHLRSRNA